MDHRRLHYRQSVISYYRSGHGPQTVVCFHGYDENAAGFQFLEQLAGSRFTFYAFDLPFHGHTQWNEGLTFTVDHLREIIHGILDREKADRQAPVFLLGFSLGGRMALSYYEQCPERVSRLVLLAPDGLKVNFWYWLSTQTLAGNRFFRFTMERPGWFFGFLKLFNRLKLVNASVFKFVNFYVGDKAARRLLYERWTSLRKIKPGIARIKSLVRENKTPVRLVYGRHDRIILSSVGEKFRKGIEAYATVRVIASGHQVLHEKHVEEILPALLT